MNFQVHFDIPFYWPLFFAVVSTALAIVMYRRQEGLARPRRVLLGVLRGLSLFLLLLAVSNLVTDFVLSSYRKKDVILLVDDSKSMSLADGGISRSQIVRRVLESHEYSDLKRYLAIKSFVFGSDVLQRANLDSLRFDRPATDIASAIEKASTSAGNGGAAFAVLVSDGDYNAGGNPVDAARSSTFPIYTIGIGDSTAARDIVVKQILIPPTIYAGKTSVVKVIVGSHGFAGTTANAHLLEDDREIGTKKITFPSDGDVEVSFGYTPGVVGTHILKVYVPPQKGEYNQRNNSASAAADVRKGKYSVLLVAGEPAVDVGFLRRNLEGSDDFEVRVLIQKTGESFYEKNSSGLLSQKYDAVVLYDFPNGESAGTLREVTGLLGPSGVPYAYFAGADFSAAQVARLPRLPFVVSGFERREYQVGIASVGGVSLPTDLQSIYTLLNVNASLLPPLYYQQVQCRAAQNASVIAYPLINGIRAQSPLFIVSSVSRSAAFLAYGIWRFQLMSSLSGLRTDFLQNFLTTLVRSLILGGRQKLLTVRTDRKVYDPSDQVNFSALLVGQNGSPVDNATVNLKITNESSGRLISEISLTPTGDGGYAGKAQGLAEGKYIFAADASSGSTFAGADTGTIVVQPLNIEFAQTSMNVTALRQIAAVTGGEFMTPTEFLNGGLSLRNEWKEPVRIIDSHRFEMLTSLPLLAVVLLLLTIEWVLRKVWGLP